MVLYTDSNACNQVDNYLRVSVYVDSMYILFNGLYLNLFKSSFSFVIRTENLIMLFELNS